MTDANELVARYIAMWNETDADARRRLIEQTWTETASYVDPLMEGQGYSGIDALVQGVHAQLAGHRFRHIGTVDVHRDRIRFSWELAPEGGRMVVAGTDFGVINSDGRPQSVTGFLDHIPS